MVDTASPIEIKSSAAVKVPRIPNSPLNPGIKTAAKVKSAVMTNAPTIHQLIFRNISRLNMEPLRERMFTAQKISAKLTVTNAIVIAVPHHVPLAMPSNEPFSIKNPI